MNIRRAARTPLGALAMIVARRHPGRGTACRTGAEPASPPTNRQRTQRARSSSHPIHSSTSSSA